MPDDYCLTDMSMLNSFGGVCLSWDETQEFTSTNIDSTLLPHQRISNWQILVSCSTIAVGNMQEAKRIDVARFPQLLVNTAAPSLHAGLSLAPGVAQFADYANDISRRAHVDFRAVNSDHAYSNQRVKHDQYLN